MSTPGVPAPVDVRQDFLLRAPLSRAEVDAIKRAPYVAGASDAEIGTLIVRCGLAAIVAACDRARPGESPIVDELGELFRPVTDYRRIST